jgi:hypothetical protein
VALVHEGYESLRDVLDGEVSRPQRRGMGAIREPRRAQGRGWTAEGGQWQGPRGARRQRG